MKVGVKQKVTDVKKPTRYYSDKQEKSVVTAIHGKQTANSGATIFGGKSDVHVKNLISIECKTKTTHSDSISIKKEWLKKLKEEACFDHNKFYSLAFNFGPDEDNYYIVDHLLFERFVEFLRDNPDLE